MRRKCSVVVSNENQNINQFIIFALKNNIPNNLSNK